MKSLLLLLLVTVAKAFPTFEGKLVSSNKPIFHEFPSVKSSNHIASNGIRILTTKKRGGKGSFFDIFKFMNFIAAKNLVL